MSYCYIDDIAIADVAFEARGASMEEMFTSAADALTNVMVDDLAMIRGAENVEIAVEHEEIDLLLFNFLNELI
ncbi:MAG: archease, partial [Geobacter sp.]